MISQLKQVLCSAVQDSLNSVISSVTGRGELLGFRTLAVIVLGFTVTGMF
jgi:hypothetical protein